jgi:putative ABC transport system ATP-binding protein
MSPPDPLLGMTSDTHVRLRNLTRSFHEGEQLHAVLQSLDAAFDRGEKVALRGRSGSGKSTLLNLISGIDVPDDGEVEIDGHVITAMSERDRTLFRRKHIGFVYQAFNLVPTLTVADNVRLVLELNAIKGPAAAERITTLLGQVGLADRANSYPDLLSGGEQQRVAIARALAHGPSLVLADEPTGNLDDRTADEVLQMLDNMVSDAGGTMIVATHSARVAKTCDRVLDLHDGRLAPRDGT